MLVIIDNIFQVINNGHTPYPTSMDNMIKQWHSIESVWNYMESSGYSARITDQLYKTPIDLSKYDTNKVDENNNYAVGASYGLSNTKHQTPYINFQMIDYSMDGDPTNTQRYGLPTAFHLCKNI